MTLSNNSFVGSSRFGAAPHGNALPSSVVAAQRVSMDTSGYSPTGGSSNNKSPSEHARNHGRSRSRSNRRGGCGGQPQHAAASRGHNYSAFSGTKYGALSGTLAGSVGIHASSKTNPESGHHRERAWGGGTSVTSESWNAACETANSRTASMVSTAVGPASAEDLDGEVMLDGELVE